MVNGELATALLARNGLLDKFRKCCNLWTSKEVDIWTNFLVVDFGKAKMGKVWFLHQFKTKEQSWPLWLQWKHTAIQQKPWEATYERSFEGNRSFADSMLFYAWNILWNIPWKTCISFNWSNHCAQHYPTKNRSKKTIETGKHQKPRVQIDPTLGCAARGKGGSCGASSSVYSSLPDSAAFGGGPGHRSWDFGMCLKYFEINQQVKKHHQTSSIYLGYGELGYAMQQNQLRWYSGSNPNVVVAVAEPLKARRLPCAPGSRRQGPNWSKLSQKHGTLNPPGPPQVFHIAVTRRVQQPPFGRLAKTASRSTWTFAGKLEDLRAPVILPHTKFDHLGGRNLILRKDPKFWLRLTDMFACLFTLKQMKGDWMLLMIHVSTVKGTEVNVFQCVSITCDRTTLQG